VRQQEREFARSLRQQVQVQAAADKQVQETRLRAAWVARQEEERALLSRKVAATMDEFGQGHVAAALIEHAELDAVRREQQQAAAARTRRRTVLAYRQLDEDQARQRRPEQAKLAALQHARREEKRRARAIAARWGEEQALLRSVQSSAADTTQTTVREGSMAAYASSHFHRSEVGGSCYFRALSISEWLMSFCTYPRLCRFVTAVPDDCTFRLAQPVMHPAERAAAAQNEDARHAAERELERQQQEATVRTAAAYTSRTGSGVVVAYRWGGGEVGARKF